MTQPTPDAKPSDAKYRIWVVHCPFRKDGTPVLGRVGRTVRSVVVIELATWKKLCQDVPQLQTTMFEVGAYDDADA